MLKFFSKGEEKPQDVKEIRHQLVQFVKEQLRKAEGGEGSAIRSICLYLAPEAGEKYLYESAVYYSEAGRFQQEEIQKVADDYAIDLPEGWRFEINFEETLPGSAVRSGELPAALSFSSGKTAAKSKQSSAILNVLSGGAEQESYTINATQGRINIGRDKSTRTKEGFGRENQIAFPFSESTPGSRFISRQHAHIIWSEEAGAFMLYADEGGIPPRNKVKLQQANGNLIRLQTTEIGHALKDGDQIVLGDSALMEFHYLNTDGEQHHE